jgi:CHAT domain-containing protein/tetratricopeptide (TPR) repeat protein
MNPVNDVHSPYLRELCDAKDWAALVRYWMAHQCEAALTIAVDVAKEMATQEGGRWSELAEFLTSVQQEPISFDRQLPDGLLASWSETGFFLLLLRPEQMALSVVDLYPRLALCELALQAPPEEQQTLLQVGIQAAEDVCKLATRSKDPALDAFGWSMIARAFLELGQLEMAREKYQEALARYRDLAERRPEVYQPYVASTLNNLGNVEHELNEMEAARGRCAESLGIYRELAKSLPDVYRPAVAMAANSLGRVQVALNDLEGARANYEEALRIRRELALAQPNVSRREVAMTLNNLGHAQRALNETEAACESLVEALSIFRDLALVQREVYQPLVALTLGNLGGVQHDLNDAETACGSFAEALVLYRELTRALPEVYHPEVARTLNSLGAALRALNDLEGARASFLEALGIRRELARLRPEVHRPEVAGILTNLGGVFRILTDLEVARANYEEALGIYRELAVARPEVYRPLLANTLNNLGNVQGALKDLDGAHASFLEALGIRRELAVARPEVYRPLLAKTLSNLGAVQGTRDDEEAARGCFQEALAIYRELAQIHPEIYRPHVAGTLNNLGVAHLHLGDLTAACDCYQQGNDLFAADAKKRPTVWLLERQQGWYNLGRLYLRESETLGWPDRHQARDAYRKARDCAEVFRGRFRDIAQRRRVQGEALHVYEDLMNVNVDLWQLSNDRGALYEAVETAEQSRARNLMEMLSEEVLSPAGAPPHLADEFRQLRRRLRHVREQLDAKDGTADTAGDGDTTPGTRLLRGPGGLDSAEIPAASPRAKVIENAQQTFDALQRQYDEALTTIRTRYDPEFNPDRPVAPVTFAQARDLLPLDTPTAFVQFCLTHKRGCAFVLTRDDAFAVPLPDLNADEGWELASAWYRSYYGSERAEWEEAVPDLLRPVSERAVRTVVAALDKLNVRRLILTPHKGLHVFPLHACTLADGTLIADRFDEVGYAPSLSILHRCAQRPRPRPNQFVLIENPTGDLAFTKVEGAGLRQLYPGTSVQRGSAADRASVLRAAPSAHVFHYSGHAGFDPNDPLKSALVLQHRKDSDGWLTLRHVFTEMHLRQTTLAVLNGCESGMVKPEQVDEYFGLAAGFLFAGAACVVSTLWSVWDLSSALLSLRFHESWRAGQTPLAALSGAQRWLRGLTGRAVHDEVLPWLLPMLETDEQRDLCAAAAATYAQSHPDTHPLASPVHWAPFTAAGLSYRLPLRHGVADNVSR